MKYRNEFLQYLLDEAESMRVNAGNQGSMSDGGAGRLETEVEIYRAGLEHEVPKYWKTDYKEFCNKQDPDYETYLQLKDKFES